MFSHTKELDYSLFCQACFYFRFFETLQSAQLADCLQVKCFLKPFDCPRLHAHQYLKQAFVLLLVIYFLLNYSVKL